VSNSYSSVTGRLIDRGSKDPLSYGTIVLKQKGQEARQTMTDTWGNFRFDSVPWGASVLNLRHVGYDNASVNFNIADAGETVELGDILMRFGTVQLSTISSQDGGWFGEQDVTTGVKPIRKLSKNVGFAGGEIEVEVKVAVADYMRKRMIIKEEIPKGFIVEAVASSGGEFSVNGQMVLFEFRKYEGADTLTVKYKISIPEKTKGVFSIVGHVFGGKTAYFAELETVGLPEPPTPAGCWNLKVAKSEFTVKQGVRLNPVEGSLNE